MQVYELDQISAPEFATVANRERLANKNKWVWIDAVLDDGRAIQYKAYNTYIQIFRIDGISHTPAMGLTATQFKQHLATI